MEVEATAAAAAFISVAIENVINVSKMEMSSIRGLHTSAAKLSSRLETINKFLHDVEVRTVTIPTEDVKDWLKKLGAVVFDAENVVDELKYHLLSKETNIFKPPTNQAKVLTYFSSCILYGSQRKLALRINEINEELATINVAKGVGLGNAPTLPHASEGTDSFLPDRVCVGRDDDVLKLADLITNTTEQEERVSSVLAIQGKGGIGKTILARELFNHESIMTRFGESRIWVHVGEAFDPVVIFTKILATFTSDRGDSRDDILKRLQQAFIGKTFLLVLDDVWNEDVSRWKDFLSSMNGVISTKGNAIIITTRSGMVAETVMPFHIHRLNFLSNEECWSIIKTITFENLDVPSGFEMIGRKFAERCQGLPLAANVVGRILRGRSEEHWRSILELPRDEEEKIFIIFRSSFQNLSPSSLKTCFAYCSIFPNGCKIVKQELIEIWMAEGFLQPNKRYDDMESMGDMFSDLLLDNSMLKVAEKDANGNVESFVMHELMHHLASSLSGSRYNADGFIPVRYLILEEESNPVPKEVAKHIRTLFLEGEISDNMLLDYPSLRNLSLTRLKELPNSIRTLIHLRNLNISKSRIAQLPEWIGELHNLQTLRADTKHLWKLPSTLKYLIKLRHLYVLSRVKLPAEMGRLTNLRTLRHFAVGENKGYQIEELKSLNDLKGELHISNLEKVRNKEKAAKANIHWKQNLSELVFRWSEEREGEINDESVLEGLQPHPNLKKLEIIGFKGKRFPSWTLKMEVQDGPQGSWVPLNNLIQITLSSCSECEEIPMLEHLPNLKSLSLIGLKKVMFMNSSFKNLVSLYIRGLEILKSLPDWLFSENPNLSKLEIIGCPNLEELPDGLDTLNSLEELNITECQNMKMIGTPSDGGGQYSKGILRVLRIVGCRKLMELPRQMVQSWVPSLKILELFGLLKLKNLPMVSGCLAKSVRLRELKIGCVPEFMNTCSVESWHFGSLQKLHLDVSGETSVSIAEKVNGILQGYCKSLTQLCLRGKDMWERVPESIQHLTALSKLELQNLGIEELPEWIGNLSSLSQLSLSSCSKLKRLLSEETLERLTNLRHLDIKDCPQLQIGLAWRVTPRLTIKVNDRWIEPCTNEIVDGDMSSAANEFLIKSLCNTLKEEYSSFRDVAQLQTTLGIIQSYLNDAQNKSIGEEVVKVWLRTLQAMALEADNVLDELNYSLLHNKVKKVKKLNKPKAKDKVLSCFSSFTDIAHRRNMASRINQINMDFKLMIKRAREHGVQSIIMKEPAAACASFETNSFTLDPIFIGRENDVLELVEKLITDIPRKTISSILAIHGVGGVGKETLTRKVFNHEDIKARFGSHIWVLVSGIVDPIMLFKKILSTLTPETSIGGAETEESILKKLQQALKAKTYILVLDGVDDVWTEDVPKSEKLINSIWDVTSTKGNAIIIITTKNPEVASLVQPLHIHRLSGLSDEDCWSIIKAKTFQNVDVPSGHEIVGRKIAKRCQGLPLAANVVGGMLRYKSEEEWSFVKENWLSDGKEDDGISNILKLSFDRLPSILLKMCFAYCSIFPKGCRIVKEELIELWMAEGFLQPNGGDDIESVGEMFSNVLLHNSLLQVAEKDGYGNVLSFVMHDLVHAFASTVLGSSDDTNQVRYLFRGKDCSSPISNGTAKSLRTLIFQGEILDTDMFSSYESLHALILDCDRVKELPTSINKLIHLRNLNISRTGIECLPDWISELHYLQTLNAFTESLRELPSTLKYLISLRHLYLCHDVELPAEIGRLTNLQALKFRVGEDKGYRVAELENLNKLKQLSIHNLEKVHDREEAQKANISQKRNLLELSFEWDADREGETNHDVAVLEGLQPHPGLKMLKIEGFKSKRFPSWAQTLIGFEELIEITLSGCQGCEEIPELGQLPNLKTLTLWRLNNVTSINSSFYGNIVGGISFPALETLLLKGMDELKVIQDFGDKVEVFPRLVSLKIYWCHRLECLPSWLFLKAHGLKELDIKHCSRLSRLPDDLHTLDSLESMTIKGCQNLRSIVNPESGLSGGSLESLRSLEIRDCPKLTEMVEPHAHLLKKVSMVRLKSLQNLPKFLDSLEHSPSLAQLTIVGVPNFISRVNIWPSQNLRKLEIGVNMELSSRTSDFIKVTVDFMLQNCISLGELKLTGLIIWDVPESISQLTALYSLELENFGVNKLPKWLKNLSHLKRLRLSNFPNLEHLPTMKRLTELQELHICNCPKIKMEVEGQKIPRGCVIYVNSHPL